MNNEYEILSHLEKNQDTSQRTIAKRTGLSVGTVNLLLKKMVRKGLVKIERLNAKTLRYIITPYGMAEKTRLVYQFMRSSYKQIVRISEVLSQSVNAYEERQGNVEEVLFYGPHDEVLEVLKLAAVQLNLKYKVMSSENELMNYLNKGNNVGPNEAPSDSCINSEQPLIIIWTSREEYRLPDNYETVDILSQI
jgi:DNA-binding Lrp family transcriptional regulator